MFVIFASVSMMIIICGGSISYFNNVNEMKEQTQSMSKVLSNQFSKTINQYFKGVERISLAVFTDPFIQQTLSDYKSQSLYEDTVLKNTMYPHLFNHVYSRQGIEGITIYTNTGIAFEYHRTDDMSISYAQKPDQWASQFDNLEKNSVLLLPGRNSHDEKVVSLVRHIYEIPQREKIGSLKIDINLDVFNELIEIEDVRELEEHLRVLVVSENNSVIFDDRHELVNSQQIQLEVAETEETILEEIALPEESTSYLYTTDHSDFTNWNTVVLIENEFFIKQRNQILMLMGFSGLFVIPIVALLSYFLSYNITKPLVLIIEKMKKVEEGDLRDRMELTGNKDIDVLTRVYNRMLDSINKLIIEVYESSITEKNAKIAALQSQINPHFLYNTLNIMKSISRVKGVEQVAEIAESLADLFKYTIKTIDQQVPLSDEVEHIGNYIRIQQHRFINRLTWEKDLTDDVTKALIPKLLIQPLIENAVIHGLAKTRRGGLITLRAFKKESDLVVEVVDNGTGISAMKIREIQERLENPSLDLEEEEGGVGLVNVMQRIQLMYGYSYGLEIDSQEGEGTIMRLTLPCHTTETDKGRWN